VSHGGDTADLVTLDFVLGRQADESLREKSSETQMHRPVSKWNTAYKILKAIFINQRTSLYPIQTKNKRCLASRAFIEAALIVLEKL
jgi:hypothetical protein